MHGATFNKWTRRQVQEVNMQNEGMHSLRAAIYIGELQIACLVHTQIVYIII